MIPTTASGSEELNRMTIRSLTGVSLNSDAHRRPPPTNKLVHLTSNSVRNAFAEVCHGAQGIGQYYEELTSSQVATSSNTCNGVHGGVENCELTWSGMNLDWQQRKIMYK
jgi:hypothetical protein